MSRQHQFKVREENILAMAEQLLLESGDGDITLDSLADQLDLAKGTLYKHFSSKDELYLRIIIRYEEQLFEINRVDDCASAGVARMIFQQLLNPQKAMLLNQIEERLAASVTGLNRLFAELYDIRRQRMKRLIDIVSVYLKEQHSSMTTRDYLCTIWAMGQGGAGLLNSSFYQRYLGRRDTLRYALVQQMLDLPGHYPAHTADESLNDEDMQDLVEQIETESAEHRNTQY
ncbi:MAG TPA: TetR family transcriptional regulator [Psychrobacter sp.]|jgi:AcrR family transcriptional regulator|uniref:TetR/AcrR family transcriptional regulator n=1 Tax=uncultured Psychrobacter sp. TaxID=259303 RepID=UPI000EC113CD|nr:TetR family transcriptional regulator [Psychrobacter sp.]|tara:strand:+ start:648 stop:1337 length:690 start_codon:yes stop_codon:yes gene_type:complete